MILPQFDFILQYVKDVQINGKLCTKWTYQINVKDKKNSYEFYVTKTVPPLPVRLVMNGYDTLLVSYYDSYVIDYHTFKKWDYDADKFKIPKCKFRQFNTAAHNDRPFCD